MTVSNPPEKGFRYKGDGRGYRVMMDGRPLERVFRVDTCAGVAWIAATDANGNMQIDRKRECVVERRVFGPMRIEPMGAV